MKRIILSIFIIVTAFALSVSAQSLQIFESGITLAQKGEFKTALAKFERSLELSNNEKLSDEFRAKIHFNIGVCLYQLKEQSKAVKEFESAITLKPNYEKAFYSLGMAQFELQNWQAAEQAFVSAIRLNKRNGEVWFDLAFVYLAQENYESAQAAFEKSIALRSVDSAISHNNLGVIFAMNGDFDAAIKEFQFALKKSNGKFAVAEKNLQYCKTLGKDFSADLLAKLEFKPKN